jgi:uncharacterized CHY-type Zn-finger protein
MENKESIEIIEEPQKAPGFAVIPVRRYRTEKVKLETTPCRKCGVEKTKEEYNKNRRICKFCQNDYNTNLYHTKYKELNKLKKIQS